MGKMAGAGLAVGLALCTMAAEPTVSDVVVRQRWPWNRLVDITYVLTGEATQQADISVKAYNGETPLPLPSEALSGDVNSVTQGMRRIVLDPVKAGYTNEVLTKFRVDLTPMETPLYMIVDLKAGQGSSTQIVYVTQSALASGAYGTVQTNPVPGIESVIWTGVTVKVFRAFFTD